MRETDHNRRYSRLQFMSRNPRKIWEAEGHISLAWNNFDICGMQWRCGLWTQFGAIVCTAALYFRLFRCVPSSGQSVYIPAKPYIAIYHKAEKKIVLLAIILLNCHYNMSTILYTEQYNWVVIVICLLTCCKFILNNFYIGYWFYH